MENLKKEMGIKVANYLIINKKWKKLRKNNNPLGDISLLEDLEGMMEAHRLPLSNMKDMVI